jgi:hypothetical protein
MTTSPYQRIVTQASGKMTYNLFRFELAAAFGGEHLKLLCGLNVDFANVNTSALKGSQQNYNVIPSRTKFWTAHYYSIPDDSVVTETSSGNFNTTWGSYTFIQVPLCFGLEYHFKLAEQNYLAGFKLLKAFHRDQYKNEDVYSYTQFMLYIGTSLSLEKKTKKDPEKKE